MHLDHILIGDTRIKWALSDLREAIRRDSAAIRENAVTETRERPSPVPTPEESAREAQSKVHEFPPASVGRLPCIGGRAQSGAEGVRRISSARVQTLHHVRGRPPPRPRHT